MSRAFDSSEMLFEVLRGILLVDWVDWLNGCDWCLNLRGKRVLGGYRVCRRR